MGKLFAGKFVLKLGRMLENTTAPIPIRNEIDLEYTLLSYIKKFLQKNLVFNKNLEGVLYHHGRDKQEKEQWTKSKSLQTVKLFGDNVSDVFIVHKRIGAMALELKYTNLSSGKRGLTAHIQRAIGQCLIAKLRHPFVICAIFYNKRQKDFKLGSFIKLKKLLWDKHRIYLIIRGI